MFSGYESNDPTATVVVADPVEIDSWLARLGLETADVTSPLLIGRAAGANTTAHNPVSAAGYYRWSESFKAMCDRLCVEERGWERVDLDHQPLVIHRGLKIALLLTSGNDETGDLISTGAANRNPKGRATRRSVRENQLVIPFPEAFAPPQDDRLTKHGLVTWFLLYALDDEGEMHAELSLPRSIDSNGIINDWALRLVFGRLDGDDLATNIVPDEPAAPVVEVARRAN